jgi:type I restriction enzyme R subunit
MESYRSEAQATLDIALADKDGEVDPIPMGIPMGSGALQSEPETDRLSRIIQEFNDRFGNIEWKDEDKIHAVIKEELPERVAADEKYPNAMRNSDRQNARIEHDRALQRAILNMLSGHTELFKQFSDNPSFKRWLGDGIFSATYEGGPR